MYYNRKLSDSFSKLIEQGGKLRWLFDFVKSREDLDFLIGKNNDKEWISIYRGLSRVLLIVKTRDDNYIKIDGAPAYKEISDSNLKLNLYGKKSISENFENKFRTTDLYSLSFFC